MGKLVSREISVGKIILFPCSEFLPFPLCYVLILYVERLEPIRFLLSAKSLRVSLYFAAITS